MSLPHEVRQRVAHDASPEQTAAAVASSFAAFLLVVLSVVYHRWGAAGVVVALAALLALGLRWVYWNGMGTFGWTSPWLRDSTAFVRSLARSALSEETLRVVCISDTHARHRELVDVPSGDVLLHCGDFTHRGTHDEVCDFNEWLGTLPHAVKVVIAGAHDVCMDAVEYDLQWDKAFRHREYNNPSRSRALLANCTYLEDRSVVIRGIKIFGSPMTPPVPGRLGAFNVARGFADQQHWAKVPADVDLLVTHGPPHGILDTTFTGTHVGSEALLKEVVSRIRPRFHVFGHVHEAYGATRVGGTVFVNAASSPLVAGPLHSPVVLDVPLKR
ncbi:unnamed protein product [Hyaloperonospora brassicae]|uniref:Calcineurin-like phosphoesterase domain-containing protein n=1 Tax=Hyaloperonospora brassicae TaxID=162125 RepID=A0AAV0U2L1_HYABA|nr:unnamed protein product [Hyaloperonospora brassicae]